MNIDKQNIEILKKLCKQYNVKTFSAFGSVLRSDFNQASDIDFAVDFNENNPFIYTDLYFKFKQDLENLLNRKIDLIEERAIKNKFFKNELDTTKQLIYGQ